MHFEPCIDPKITFERYAVKTSEKANMHNRAGFPRTDLPTPRIYLGGTISYNRGRVSTPATSVARLSARYILAGDYE